MTTPPGSSFDRPSRTRHLLAVAGLFCGPALYTAGELLHHQAPSFPVVAAAIACFGLYLWIAGVLGMVHLLRPSCDRLGLVGGGLALLGIVAVSNIMLLQLVFVLIEQKAENYPEVIDGVFRYVLSITYIFGPVFPLGLFVLGLGLHWCGEFPRPATAAFLLGAATFPVGRIAGVPLLIHASDLVLTVGSVAIAWHLWKHPALWVNLKRSGG